jgi:ABC-type sugar transport system ATPase subunit
MTQRRANDTQSVVSLRNVAFEYVPGEPVLQDVSLDLVAGQRYALVGPNGAGKTTLIGIIAGRRLPTHGEVLRCGQNHGRARIGVVEQQLSVFPSLTVAENVTVGAYDSPFARTRSGAMRTRCLELFKSLELEINVDATVGELTFPEQQLVEVARAIGTGQRLLILDEPTSALDAARKESLFAMLDALSRRGMTVLLVSHDRDEVARRGFMVSELDDGRLIHQGDHPAPDKHGIVFRERGEVRTTGSGGRTGEIRVSIGQREVRLPLDRALQSVAVFAFDDSYVRSRASASLALGGLGTEEAYSRLSAEEPTNPTDSHGSAAPTFLLADRQRYALYPTLSVAETAAVIRAAHHRLGAFDSPPKIDGAIALLQALSGVYRSVHQEARTLSGGNQQKLIVASMVAAEPKVLIAEEPLLGLDRRSQAAVVSLLTNLADRGGTVVVLTAFPRAYESLGLQTVPASIVPTHRRSGPAHA